MNVGPYALHPHQERAVTEARREIGRLKHIGSLPRIIIQGPCGVGKTVISSMLFKLALEKGNRCAFLASGRQLVFQKSRKLMECSIPHSVLMSGERFIPETKCVVASKDTLWARNYELDCDLLIVDEAHLALSEDWLQILQANPSTVVIGLTATPARNSGKSLGAFYQSIVVAATYSEMLERGFLCQTRIYAPYSVDMSGVKVDDGEYVMGQVAKRFDKPELVGDVVAHWKRLAEDRPTGVFASGVEHSMHLAEEFNKAGIPATHIDAETEQKERDEVFGQLTDGTLKVVCNFGVMRTGVDVPALSCGQLAVSMASLNTYLQTCGRFFRTFPGKTDALLIDHGGNVHRHGWPNQDHEWSLDEKNTVQERDKEQASTGKPPMETLTCSRCGAVRGFGPTCKSCGCGTTRRGELVRMADGTLEEVLTKEKKPPPSPQQKCYLECLAIAARKNLPVAAARILYRKKMNEWPGAELEPRVPASEWKRKVSEMFPGFIRGKKQAAQ